MKPEFIMIKCDEEYKKKVKRIAKEKGMNVSELFRYLVARNEEESKRRSE